MPVTFNSANLSQFIDGIKLRFDSPELVTRLGQELAKDLGQAFSASGLQSRSGAGLAALTTVGEPTRNGRGWQISVGDKSALGSKNDPAPKGTLAQFYTYLEGTGRVRKYTKWAQMSKSNQELLEKMRRAGLMGGRGPKYANYMWIQNYGNATAQITGRHFIENGLTAFRARSRGIINDWWNKSGHMGGLRVRVD